MISLNINHITAAHGKVLTFFHNLNKIEMFFSIMLYAQHKLLLQATSDSNNRRHYGLTKHWMDVLQGLRTTFPEHVQQAHDVLE